jgi:hypothetical protein
VKWQKLITCSLSVYFSRKFTSFTPHVRILRTVAINYYYYYYYYYYYCYWHDILLKTQIISSLKNRLGHQFYVSERGYGRGRREPLVTLHFGEQKGKSFYSTLCCVKICLVDRQNDDQQIRFTSSVTATRDSTTPVRRVKHILDVSTVVLKLETS